VRILTRYLLREHLGPFLFALGALTGLMVLNQVARQFGNLIGKGLPWSVIGEVFALSLPFILAMTIPMAVLVAVLHAFTRLGADSEIVALKASGVHLGRFVLPVVGAAALLAALTFLFVDQVLPRSNHLLKTLLVDIARKKPTFELREQAVNEVVQGQLFLRAGRIDQAADRMRDVVIYDLGRPERRRTIYADSGYVRYNTERTDLFLTLFDGYVHDYNHAEAGTFRRVFFGTDLVRVRGVSNTLQRTEEDSFRGDREMSICEMTAVVADDRRALSGIARERRSIVENDLLTLVGVTPLPADTAPAPRRSALTDAYCRMAARVATWFLPRAVEAQQRPWREREGGPRRRRTAAPDRAAPAPGAGTVSPAPSGRAAPAAGATAAAATARPPVRRAADPAGEQLRAQFALLDSRQRSTLQHAASFQVEIHKKFAIALSCLVFVVIGAPVALRFPRGGVGLVIGASVVIFGIYYIGLIGGETLADRLIIPPFWAMWGPNLLMGALGLLLFRRLGHETATARGGGWPEWLERWRARLARRSAA
jgi:lipopolysaccharide export system permease protein